jgi:chloride channel protein, CIC family
MRFEPRLSARFRLVWRRLRPLRRGLEILLARRFGLATREDRIFFSLIPLVGLIAGALGIVVHRLIDGFRHLLWGPRSLLSAASTLPAWQVIGAPVVGGLLVALLVVIGRQALTGQGMSALIEAVALRGGRMRARPVLLRAVAAIATVGSGGSLGREGPMIRLGAMIASRLGSGLRLPPYRVKILVGCGAAAGLAAAYNIPIGGALFAMEVILGNFALEIFGPIVVASVISTLLARAAEGHQPIYAVQDLALVSGWEMFSYAGLGVVGGLASVVFVLGLRGSGKLFERLPVPAWGRPPLGMALVGVFALLRPEILGSGFDTITVALQGQLPLMLLLVLPFAKLLATALTVGSGGAGGLFTPGLFIGATVGAAWGQGMHMLFPHGTTTPGAYAAVGMAAVAAGTSHAPLSAILILFEFTGNYDLILPLMVATILASLVSRGLYKYSIYTEPLQRQGIDLALRMEEAVLAGLTVGELAREDAEVLRPADPYAKVIGCFLNTSRERLFVVGESGDLVGAVSLHDIKHGLVAPGDTSAVTARDMMKPVGSVLATADRLHRAVEVFAQNDFERLPVEEPSGRFRGLLAKRDLLAIYAQEVLGRPAMLATFVSSDEEREQRSYVDLPPDYTIGTVAVSGALAGRTLAEARLPQQFGVRVLEVRRSGSHGAIQKLVPSADTVLCAEDDLVLMGPTSALRALERGELPESG